MSKPKRGAAAKRRGINGVVKAKAMGLMAKPEPIKKTKCVILDSPKEAPRPAG